MPGCATEPAPVSGRRRAARVSARFALAFAAALSATTTATAQELGHKVLGAIGLQAGSQPPTGLYVADRFLFYDANELFDRTGRRIPGAFDLNAFADAVGVGFSYELPRVATFVNAAVAIPIARVHATSDRLEAAIDRFGLADVYIEPLRLGWRLTGLDLIVGYAFYVPTGRYEPGPGGGVSRAQWSHELSLGATVSFDYERTWQLSALSSWQLNQRKIGIDLTRGDTVQIQGGLGKRLFHVVELGPVAYALWQVRDDSGSALPPALRGARDRVLGIGAELAVTIPPLRSRLLVRYAHDLGSEARPQGQIVVAGITVTAWRPRAATTERSARPK